MSKLVLYTRERCHLCDEMEDDVQLAWRESTDRVTGDLVIQRRDVDSQAHWRECFGLRVPVLCLDHPEEATDQEEICSGRFDQQAFDRWLNGSH